MNTSYKINNKYLLHSINLPLHSGKTLLVTGVENNNLNLLSGIIGRLFPLKAKIDIPQISVLITKGLEVLIAGTLGKKHSLWLVLAGAAMIACCFIVALPK